jgi:late competence protein required for DNA uptake (superfamily II DNA/RNA helicase)
MNRIKSIVQLQNALKTTASIVIAKTHGCSVCLPVTMRLYEIMESYPSIPIFELYIEDVPEFRGQYLVFTVPTIILFYEGKEILRESRFIDWHNLVSTIEKIQ